MKKVKSITTAHIFYFVQLMKKLFIFLPCYLKLAMMISMAKWIQMDYHRVKQTFNNTPFWIILFFFLLQWFLLFDTSQGSWDGGFYYAYARSIVFDGDLEIANDLILSYPTAPQDYVNKAFEKDLTVTGRVNTPFAIGSGLFWVPWLAFLRMGNWVAVQSFLGGWIEPTGYEWFFVGGVAAFSVLITFLTFYLIFKIAAKVTNQTSAVLATIILMFTTPLLHYQFRAPFYSHTSSAFFTTLVIFFWYRWWRRQGQQIDYFQAVLLGGFIGLATIVRWQHIVYLILPFSTAVWHWWQQPYSERRHSLPRLILFLALTILAAFAVISLQLSFWNLYFGSWVTIPQGSDFIDWTASYLLPVLFSTFHGLFTWMPVAIFFCLWLVVIGQKKTTVHCPAGVGSPLGNIHKQ